MMSISTDKKLELLRGIRLENQRNHQLMQERQHILEAPSFRETSISGMEELAVPDFCFLFVVGWIYCCPQDGMALSQP